MALRRTGGELAEAVEPKRKRSKVAHLVCVCGVCGKTSEDRYQTEVYTLKFHLYIVYYIWYIIYKAYKAVLTR